jgi:hypothetical protein
MVLIHSNLTNYYILCYNFIIMANVLLIEDFDSSIMAVQQIIDESEHTFIGYADTITRTQTFLSKIISKEISVDVLLLDGNLGNKDPSRSLTHIFPIDESAKPTKRLLRKPLLPQAREITVRPDGQRSFGADARMIKEFMKLCDIEIPIIGMSGESMEKSGVSVDYDYGYNYGKLVLPHQGPQLLAAIDQVLS